jgi:hypothetical protein
MTQSPQDNAHRIREQLQTLRPLSDAEIAARAAAGESIDELLTQAQALDRKRRVLEIQLQQAEAEQFQLDQDNARPAIKSALDKREQAIAQARKSLAAAQEAANSFAGALADFAVAAQDAEQAAYDANATAKRVALPEQVARPELADSVAFHALEQQLHAALKPYRRPGSQLGKFDLAHN